MKHKVSDLEGALLDAAVAKAEGWVEMGLQEWEGRRMWVVADQGAWPEIGPWVHDWHPPPDRGGPILWDRKQAEDQFRPSTNWQQGGPPIIERERITPIPGNFMIGTPALARHPSGSVGTGPTPLIAAMRAYCASKFGEEVELP